MWEIYVSTENYCNNDISEQNANDILSQKYIFINV